MTQAPITDRQRAALLRADDELAAIASIADHAGLSDIARERIDDALDQVRHALAIRRREAGLETARVQ